MPDCSWKNIGIPGTDTATIFDRIGEMTETIDQNPLPLGEDFFDLFKDED